MMKDINDIKLDYEQRELKKPIIKQKMMIHGIEREIEWFDGETLETSKSVSYKDGFATYNYETPFGALQKNIARIERSGLAELVERYTFDRYQTKYTFQKIIKEQALNFLNEKGCWFSVLGQSGSGKTHICTAISIELMKQGRQFEYVLWMEAINRIKHNRFENERTLERYRTVDVLYIDDFLKTRNDTEPTDIEVELAFEILDARYRANKTTIISSEKTIEQIKKYDYAVHRRILELSKQYLLKIGKDERKDMSIELKEENENENN